MNSTTVRVDVLGGLRVSRSGVEERDLPSQPTRAALLLLLAMERRLTRDEAVAVLWRDREPDRARHSLRQALYELRRTLGNAWIRVDGDTLEATDALQVDALEVLDRVSAGDDDGALAGYRGPFLDGVHLGVGRAFEAWTDGWRARLERGFRELCRRMHGARVAAGDADAAMAVARAWSAGDPLDDEAQHALLAALAAAGHRAEALRHFERYAERIRRELQVEPLDETLALVAEIRSGRGEGFRDAEPTAESVPATAEPLLPTAEPVLSAAEPGPPRRRRPPALLTALGLATVGVLAAGVLLLSRGDGGADPGDPERFPPAAAQGIAVLPFENGGPDPDQGYLADGITEDLITALSRIEGLRVISRASVMRYRGTGLPAPRIGEELQVAYLLSGSVRPDGDRVRITAHLVDARADAQLWADAFDRELVDVFRLNDEITGRIAAALAQRLTPGAPRLAELETRSREAYDLVLRGREFLNRPGEGDLEKYALAREAFGRALSLDPDHAPGYVGMSRTWRRNVAARLVPVRRDSVLHYAAQAVERAPFLADAVVELAWGHLMAGERSRAESRFVEALSLDANQADAWEGLAVLEALQGRLDQAVLRQARAMDLDPLSVTRTLHLASYLFDLGALDRTEALLERAVTLAPDHPEAAYLRAQVHRVRGRDNLAEARIRRLQAAAPPHPGVDLVVAQHHADLGRSAEVEAVLATSAMGSAPAALVFRSLAALAAGDAPRARELIREPDALLAGWEAEGLTVPPRGQVVRALVRGDLEGALQVLRDHGPGGMRWIEDPPRMGIYWLELEPLGRELARHPEMPEVMAGLREVLDRQRAEVEARLVMPHFPASQGVTRDAGGG